MKKFIIGLILCIALIATCISCGNTRHLPKDQDNTEIVCSYNGMMYTLDKDLCQYQLDSMIRVDHMAPLSEWIQSPFGSKRTQYLYIRRLGPNELIYTVTTTPCDTIYKCTKRETKNIQ